MRIGFNYLTMEVLKNAIWKELEEVKDPEIPVISIIELGMITGLDISDSNEVKIYMIPTFTACPAIEVLKSAIKKQIVEKLQKFNFKSVTVELTHDIAWSSNRITEKGKKILKQFGLAPPPVHDGNIDLEMLEHTTCPYCDSNQTSMKSSFGSTLCRSIHYCNHCRQSFEQFKPL